MGNVVGLPQMVIPVQFEPVSLGSPRQQATALGIYALPNEDSKVRCSRLTQQCVSFGLGDPAGCEPVSFGRSQQQATALCTR